MKKFLILFFLVPASIFAAPRVSQDLSCAVQCIHSLPEGRNLLQQAETQGPIQIYAAPFRIGCHAMWKPDERAIVVNSACIEGFGQVVRSILFELHNAVLDQEFCRLDNLAMRGQISRQYYIESRERMEHSNAIKTKAIVLSAIERGLMPHDSYWNIPDDFNTYYQCQIQAGHSEQIGIFYDELAPNRNFARR